MQKSLIMQLARQAYADERLQEYAGWQPNDMSDALLEDLAPVFERFAEAIAQECAQVCEQNAATYQYSFTPAKAQASRVASEHCGRLIRAAFNVKDLDADR